MSKTFDNIETKFEEGVIPGWLIMREIWGQAPK